MYDAMYSTGGYEKVYLLPYHRSHYYPLFKSVLAEIQRRGATAVLEVGCGNGRFAHMLFDRTTLGYHGFDFSEVGVSQAREKTGRADSFSIGDATTPESYSQAHDIIVCMEVLEHIHEDRETVNIWPSGAAFVCSVPNFDASNHERFFTEEAEVQDRYGNSLEIEKIVRVRKPWISDLGVRSRLKELRWARSDLRKIVKVLGFPNFEEDGGWFVFSGHCR